jgi:hypothetical protein
MDGVADAAGSFLMATGLNEHEQEAVRLRNG